MATKPLKIVRKIAEAPSPAVATPGTPTAVKVKKFRPLSIRAQNAIKGVLAGKTKGDAMRDAGYSETSAKVPGAALFNKPAVEAELDEFIQSLKHHQRDLLQSMREEKLDDVPYAVRAMSLASAVKLTQVLTGKPTGKITFEVDEETQNMIKGIISDNSE